ncbi:MAG: Hydrogenase maturation protease [Myxococcales bacterium]|nr:Hydrogenase maturation protease [Myxococcales bacterium]
MTRTLVAGIGNIFFGDDGFGVEVARRLAGTALPEGTRVADYGIRGVHLAYDLLETIDCLIVADCVPRGGEPGTLYLIEPDVDDLDALGSPRDLDDAHGMQLPAVFASVRTLGGRLPPIRIVGCEPADTSPHIGLSPAIEGALAGALEMIRDVIARPPPRENP